MKLSENYTIMSRPDGSQYVLHKESQLYICELNKAGQNLVAELEAKNINHIENSEGVAEIENPVGNIGFDTNHPERWYCWYMYNGQWHLNAFEIGDECTYSCPAYVPKNAEELELFVKNSYTDIFVHNMFTSITDNSIELMYTYIGPGDESSNHTVTVPFPEHWGHGEWIAKSSEDAKQMCIDNIRNSEM